MKGKALHVELCLHHIMKIEKQTFNFYIYTLFLDCFFFIVIREESMGI